MIRTPSAGAGPALPWRLRPPDPGDGPAVHALITTTPPLDPNSLYAYLLHGLHFASTCVLAERDGTPCGYVSGYRLPDRPDTLFIWQVAVAADCRGQGLGRAMLRHLLARPAHHDLRWLEATVGPANQASTQLFHGLARDLACACATRPLFAAATFGAGHDAEQLFRIGPFRPHHPDDCTQEEPHGHVDLRTP